MTTSNDPVLRPLPSHERLSLVQREARMSDAEIESELARIADQAIDQTVLRGGGYWLESVDRRQFGARLLFWYRALERRRGNL